MQGRALTVFRDLPRRFPGRGRAPGDQPRCVRYDRFPGATRGGWCSEARDDPTTGLVAWPDFFACLPSILHLTLRGGVGVGLAIGDVDNLKSYVEGRRAVDAQSFGHLAGNAFMGRLGTISRGWLSAADLPLACLATFGGDEIVVVAATNDSAAFAHSVGELRDQLCAGLPRTVSFSTATIQASEIPALTVGTHWWREFAVHTIGAVERSLFDGKEARRAGADVPLGFVVDAVHGQRL
ncbi:GGDEF domain-containing protein [Kribbella sp. NPDC023972]|uniref:GGDEF domain-containing protein n=1 Tax=Kribbella sp. NPDC023972 TaxID=3154795 RepID=UPI0033F3C51E